MGRTVVTGGAGFIGSHVVDTLSASGHELAVIDDLSSGSRENLGRDVTFLEADVRSSEAARLMRDFKPEIVVHAAAQISVRESMAKPSIDVSVNVGGLINLLEAIRGDRLPYFVFISTGGAIYGEQQHFPATETHPVRPTSVYGLSKHVSELYLELWERSYGLPWVSLRLANVYGPRQNPHGEAGVVAIFNKTLLSGKRARINGSGEQTRDYVFVQDVAQAVAGVCLKRVSGVFNIGTGVETSVNSLYRYIAENLGVSASPEHGPAQPGEQLRSCIDASLARVQFGWEARTPLTEGLKATSDWFRKSL